MNSVLQVLWSVDDFRKFFSEFAFNIKAPKYEEPWINDLKDLFKKIHRRMNLVYAAKNKEIQENYPDEPEDPEDSDESEEDKNGGEESKRSAKDSKKKEEIDKIN